MLRVLLRIYVYLATLDREGRTYATSLMGDTPASNAHHTVLGTLLAVHMHITAFPAKVWVQGATILGTTFNVCSRRPPYRPPRAVCN